MKKHLIIGFGTGRCGTTSLSAFLNAQDRVRVFHEGRLEHHMRATPFAWEGDEEYILNWIDQLTENNPEFEWIGDIGMYYINYVDAIIKRYPDVRFICMQRPEKEVVQSYLKWTKSKNHWTIHDGTTWKYDTRWDKAYPKFDTHNKEKALHLYWTSYTQQTSALKSRLPEYVKVVDLADFNIVSCRESILDFIGYTGIRNVSTRFAENSIKRRRDAVLRKKFAGMLLSLKRILIGRPGKRWFIKQRSV